MTSAETRAAGGRPRIQRVAAYAVITRGLSEQTREVLLSRIAPRISPTEAWTFPGGGVEHGEDPREALVREIAEETGLQAMVSDEVRVRSAAMPGVERGGRTVDAHAIRIIYDAWVATDAPQPHVVEVDGSTVDAAWHRLADVRAGVVPVVAWVADELAEWRPFRLQRVAAYAVVRRGDAVLLTRLSSRTHRAGAWTLPGGGVEHGEAPRAAVVREVAEECGVECLPGGLITVHDVAFTGVAPSGRTEDFHGIHVVFAATLPEGVEPRLAEAGGSTDAVAWIDLADIAAGRIEVLDVVRAALDA